MTVYPGQLNLVMDLMYTRLFWKCNLVCICLHVVCFSIWVAHHFTRNWNATRQFFFATDPSNQKWSLIDCKTASCTSCFSPGLSADSTPPSHCALPLLLPVNQSEPSVFVMVEDNQVSKLGEKKMVERRQAERRRRGEEEKGRRKEAHWSSRWLLPYLACCGAYDVQH